MKQIINRKLYNTETSMSLASIKNSAVLYETKKGNFFLYHIEPNEDNWIEPLSHEEAKSWYEKLAPHMDCEETFGGYEEA